MKRFAGFDVVLIAASQGAAPVMRTLAAALPPDFPAALIYAQHRSPGSSTAAADLLSRQTALEVRIGVDGDELRAGTTTRTPPPLV